MTRTPFIARLRLLPSSLAIALAVSAPAHAVPDWNLQPPVTPIARQMYDLHFFIFWICVVIFVAVFGVMFYSLYRHRKSREHPAAHFHENTIVEIVWTVIPFLILLFMAFPATKTILAMKDTSAPGLTIKVTGNQWSWNYDYLQEGFGYYSNLSTPVAQIENRAPKGEHYLLEVDNPLVVPVDTKVRVLLTASDVLHAWWVPAFGVKQDADPGLRPRHVVQGREGRRLSRPVRRALRQGPRLHADRRRSEVEGRFRQVGRRAQGQDAGRRRRPEQGVGPEGPRRDRREDLRRRIAQRATSRTAKACRGPSRRSTARRSSEARRPNRSTSFSTASPGRRCRRGRSSPTSISLPSSPIRATASATRQAKRCSLPKSRLHASKAAHFQSGDSTDEHPRPRSRRRPR